MISSEVKRAIKALLQQAQRELALLPRPVFQLVPAESIQLQVIRDELKAEIKSLTSIIGRSSDVENAFVAHCIKRVKRNHGTCLSYTVMPEGVSNRLVVDIYRAIFPEATMDELINRFMPGVTHCVIPELLLIQQSAPKKVDVRVHEEEGFAALDMPIPFDFSKYVVVGNILFDVSMISNFSFELHQSCYQQLQRDHPALAHTLYEHNHPLALLHRDLQVAERQALPPYQVIQNFSAALRRGGSTQTNEVFASNDAQSAYTDFKAYLASLPDATRVELLALSAGDGTRSLDFIINTHLGVNEGCVEVAAGLLDSILSWHANLNLLKTSPSLSPERKNELKGRYGPNSTLSSDAAPKYAHNRRMPLVYLEKVKMKGYLKLTTKEYISIVGDFILDTTNPALQYHRDYGLAFKALTDRYAHTREDPFGFHRQLGLMIQTINKMKPTAKVLHVIQSTNQFLQGDMTREQYLREANRLKTPFKNALVNVLAVLMVALSVALGFALGYLLFGVITANPVLGIAEGVCFGLIFMAPGVALASRFARFFRPSNELGVKIHQIADLRAHELAPEDVAGDNMLDVNVEVSLGDEEPAHDGFGSLDGMHHW